MFVPGKELEPAFLSGLLNFVFSFLLLLDRSHVLRALSVCRLLFTALANDPLALIVWHRNLLVRQTTHRKLLGSNHAAALSSLCAPRGDEQHAQIPWAR
jgi:hypothetical protein